MWFIFDTLYCVMTTLLNSVWITQLRRQDIPEFAPNSLQNLAALKEILKQQQQQ